MDAYARSTRLPHLQVQESRRKFRFDPDHKAALWLSDLCPFRKVVSREAREQGARVILAATQ